MAAIAAAAATPWLPPGALAAEKQEGDGRVVAVSNEFIRIRVNRGPEEAGRFAVDTTGGDPSRSADDNKVLIYGSRDPWTSYTTVLVDGEPFLFGGATARRAGQKARVGMVTSPPRIVGDAISCTTTIGGLEVVQELGFARSPTTRVKDAARISYRITNHNTRPVSVGLRVMLDTMLGTNDGAPLRAGERAVSTATRMVGDEVPEYWQAFDSLANPSVISQGTLRAAGLTPPDRLEMVDWGTLADQPWDFPFPTGADFTRHGEEEQDTAVALYWNPVALAPGETRTYATLYGVGGVSLSPAALSLGLTAPAEVDYQYGDTRAFSVIAYVENSGGFESRGTVCRLELPRGLALGEGRPETDLGRLAPGETRQLSWKVRPTGEDTGALKIAASVVSENLEPNLVEREVIVNSPPRLAIVLTAPDKLSVTPQNRYSPNPFEVKAVVNNAGAQAGRNLVVTLTLPDGLRLVEGQTPTRVAERLDPGNTQSFSWQVVALGMPTGKLTLSVTASAAGAEEARASRSVQVPWLTPELRVYPAEQRVPAETDGQPTLVPIAVKLAPAREFFGARISLRWDPTVLDLLYVSRGEAFVHEGRLLSPWSGGRAGHGQVVGVGGERSEAPVLNSPEATLFTLVFVVKGQGDTVVEISESSLVGGNGQQVEHKIMNGRLSVAAMEEQ